MVVTVVGCCGRYGGGINSACSCCVSRANPRLPSAPFPRTRSFLPPFFAPPTPLPYHPPPPPAPLAQPENVLVDTRGNIKLSGFALAGHFLPSRGNDVVNLLHACCGTPDYVAPEVRVGGGCSGSGSGGGDGGGGGGGDGASGSGIRSGVVELEVH